MTAPIIVPAIQARMGSTSYYQAVLRADELARSVQAAMDFSEFKSFMESELMQRPMNERRVEQEIIPYLCMSPDRFFGSIIVLVYQPELFEFRPWSEFGEYSGPVAFRSGTERSGILQVGGGKLFALDGQHRLHALRTLVEGKRTGPRSGLPIEGPYRSEVPDDELSVIFVPYESTEKARRIFNKVNRYAKPTSHSMNLLFSEDDGYAIITRCLIGVDDPDKFGGVDSRPLNIRSRGHERRRLVEIEKVNLTTSSDMFTTINAVHDMVKQICHATGQPDLDEKTNVVRPDDAVLAVAYNECVKWFDTLTTNFVPWRSVFDNPYRISGARHMDEPWSMVFRPIGQDAFIEGLCLAHKKSRLSIATLTDRANRLPLSLADRVWQGVLCGSNGKMITKYRSFVSRLVAYLLIGDDVGARERAYLEAEFRRVKADANDPVRSLPRPVRT